MRDGVSTRASRLRSSSWRGGSMLKMFGGSSVMSVSTNVPRADENVRQSRSASLTSLRPADHPVVRPHAVVRDLAAVDGMLGAHLRVVRVRVGEVGGIERIELEHRLTLLHVVPERDTMSAAKRSGWLMNCFTSVSGSRSGSRR